MSHLPDKTTGCHRTGFAKTCFECVTQHGCRLWKPLRVDADRASGKTFVEHWDCVDAHAHTLGVNMLGRQDTTSASVDALRKEVAQANDAGMASTLAGLNAQIRRMDENWTTAIAADAAPKLIGSN